ncbi:hypothetical protein N181_00535 [Sinorhizobium fredii USDA 205]|nr:hypothetical protein AOX55_0000127 [Sinorhizobium fredii CCBAU 25509]KSV92726.1 hypothetical protein N181_00535 [Sinorhizobium fredii USDA 205]
MLASAMISLPLVATNGLAHGEEKSLPIFPRGLPSCSKMLLFQRLFKH